MHYHPWIGKCAVPSAGLAATLFLALAGCGGGSKTDEGTVVLPSEPLQTSSAPSTAAPATAPTATASNTPAPAPSTSGGTAAPAPAAGGGGEGWGTLKGHVVFNGNAPEPKSIDTSSKDPNVCAKTPHKSQRLLVDGATKGVRYALVYIPKPTKANPEAQSAASSAKVEFDQKECTFEPHVLAAMKGATIVLKSSDPINHNINAKMRTNSPFNSVLQPSQTVNYQPPAAERGPIEVNCDIHPWMRAYWLIIDSPYFAVTDEKGNYEIKNVPAGSQKVVVWQEATNYVTPASGEAITIKAGGTTDHDFQVDASKVKGE